ncbi:Hypothetical protein FKW44_007044, partial [Caligus rogercresseyi]
MKSSNWDEHWSPRKLTLAKMVAEHTAMASEYKGPKGSWRAKKNAPQEVSCS